MSSSKQLRNNTRQHKVKNIESKVSDKSINRSMMETKRFLEERHKKRLDELGFEIIYSEKALPFGLIVQNIKNSNKNRKEYYYEENRSIQPDGGVIILTRKNENPLENHQHLCCVILISETKKQGTNDERQKEGKEKQATGNAIERLGKNLSAIRAMFKYDEITPFICFGHGCDFSPSSKTVLMKLAAMNEFYEINKIYIKKADRNSAGDAFQPVSMFFREKEWSEEEMFDKMTKIAEVTLQHYLLKLAF